MLAQGEPFTAPVPGRLGLLERLKQPASACEKQRTGLSELNPTFPLHTEELEEVGPGSQQGPPFASALG